MYIIKLLYFFVSIIVPETFFNGGRGLSKVKQKVFDYANGNHRSAFVFFCLLLSTKRSINKNLKRKTNKEAILSLIGTKTNWETFVLSLILSDPSLMPANFDLKF